MVKNLEWNDYSHTTVDDDGDSHESVVKAAVVSKDFNGTEVTTISGARVVKEGDVIVRHPGDGYVDVVNAEDWAKNYGKESGSNSEGNSSVKSPPAQNVRKS